MMRMMLTNALFLQLTDDELRMTDAVLRIDNA